MRARWRVLLVLVPEPPRGPRLATAERPGLPPRDLAASAATLAALGAEVRLMDPGIEQLSFRVVAREARWWHADLILLHAGGPSAARDPVPDARPLTRLLAAGLPDVPILLVGPLGECYADELLATLPGLTGVHRGPLGPWMVGGYDPASAPGLQRSGRPTAPPAGSVLPDPPAWQLLNLDAYPRSGPSHVRVAGIADRGDDLQGTLAEVRHAVQRAGAGHLVFEARDFGAQRELAIDLAHRMFGAAPRVAWECRVRADHLDPTLALALAQGACAEVLVVPPSPPTAPGLPPMDDADREPLEAALESVRVTGMAASALFLVGRPGHRPSTLEGWQRWFAVRGVPVRPQVRRLHAGDQGPGEPRLAEAARHAGCWDNELAPTDVERAVRGLSSGAGAGPAP